jgi:D-alanyl-D-alanine carboxypeptidase
MSLYRVTHRRYAQLVAVGRPATAMLCAVGRIAVLVGVVACGARTDAETLAVAVERQLVVNAQRHGIAGQAVLIVHDGKIVYRGSQGVANRDTGERVQPDHIFPVFSVAKLFASVLVMQLVERGELDLEQSAGRYAADLPERWRSIQVKELLDHASGLPEYFDASRASDPLPATRDAVFASLADRPLVFPTGTATRYTQTNYLVLEAVLEARYGKPYRQLVEERILAPLGLHDTYLGKDRVPEARLVKSYRGQSGQLAPDVVIDWPEYSLVHTELYTTLDDLGGFLAALCNGRLVRRDTLLRLWKPYRYRSGGAGEFASGWEYGRRGAYQHVGHDGGTVVRVRLLFDVALGSTYAFVYLTNGSAQNVWSRTLVDSVIDVAARFDRSL